MRIHVSQEICKANVMTIKIIVTYPLHMIYTCIHTCTRHVLEYYDIVVQGIGY